MKGATKYRSIASLALWLSLLLLNASCGNSLFKVKPAGALPPLSAAAASANVGVITFRAAPLLTDEETQKLFESNLQLAGLLPIRLEVIHHGGDPIEFKKLKFRLHDASSSDWKLISANLPMSPVNVIIEDPDKENVLYCGTDMGAYVSKDGGKKWFAINANMPAAVAVDDMFIHPPKADKKLVIATYGRGVWVLDSLPKF